MLTFPLRSFEPEVSAQNSGRGPRWAAAKSIFAPLALLVLAAGSAFPQPAIDFNAQELIVSPGHPLGIEAVPNLAIAEHACVLTAAVENPAAVAQTDHAHGFTMAHLWAAIEKLTRRAFNLDALTTMIFGWPFWVALVFTLVLERIIPAVPNPKIFRVSFLHDIVWFLYEPTLHALILGTYVSLLQKVYSS